jgi:arginyl-tRNA synthetase
MTAMDEIKDQWKTLIHNALINAAVAIGLDKEIIDARNIIIETPPKSELGDIAFPMFQFAKVFKKSPHEIAADLYAELSQIPEAEKIGTVTPLGPYLNIKLNRYTFINNVLSDVIDQGSHFGQNTTYNGQKTVIEFSCPNTNKPLHLGHLRNDSIGESLSKILFANGAEVSKVNLINDRGIHICKSMLAYEKFGKGQTPDNTGVKSDHFVGDYYIKFTSWAADNPEADEQSKEMLQKWENNDPKVRKLWSRMNNWAISGINTTYERTGVNFDKLYLESETYIHGKDEVLKGLEKGIFYQGPDNAIWVDLEDIKLDKKVLLRADGTSLYLTQDIGTAIKRHEDYSFDRMIYVVGSEQEYHFKVLFHILKKLGFSWSENMFHLSYGLVHLPEGKMKSREGKVVDADDLLDSLTEMAAKEILTREREEAVGDITVTAEKVALGALNYYLLQVTPSKDMIFNPAESLSFTGNTGPYLQYMGARISSMLKKYSIGREHDSYKYNPELLKLDDEWEIIKLISKYPLFVKEAASQMNPSLLTAFLYDLSKTFSKYYHDTPILHNEDEELVQSRIALVYAVKQVLENAFTLIGVPFLDTM